MLALVSGELDPVSVFRSPCEGVSASAHRGSLGSCEACGPLMLFQSPQMDLGPRIVLVRSGGCGSPQHQQRGALPQDR